MDNMFTSVRNQARGIARRLHAVPGSTEPSSGAAAPMAPVAHRRNAMGIDVSPVHGRYCDCHRCLADSGHDAA